MASTKTKKSQTTSTTGKATTGDHNRTVYPDIAPPEVQARPEPLDLHGAADLLGISADTVRYYRKGTRGTSFPSPDGRIGNADWWWPETLVAWNNWRREQGRQIKG